eukprot:CAMPEP_0177784790 /NCGR_PEP_ID=MMETSP0491_2-20121128/19920_1 /TAXON_ID=63592 /ORGANISM="Tetraselmis chuii, Strain PLY429" /LENGTH=178 /DNA_ID=CAMNT_0019305643 /DNA_START=183 /DNA_END=715 /DNA_ORIENTATION=+
MAFMRRSVSRLLSDARGAFNLTAPTKVCGSSTTSSLQVTRYFSEGVSACSEANAVKASDYPPHYLFSMPSLSPLMTEGRILEWKVGEGDWVNAFDLICDIETESLTEREDEKFTLELESQEDACLAKVLIPAGPVGTPVAIFAQSKEDCPSFEKYAPPSEGRPSANEEKLYWQAYVKG